MEPGKFLSPKYRGTKQMTQLDVPIANATGFGAAADDYMERGIDLNEALVHNKPATFFMKVSSDAMKGSGIYKGDVAIVDRSVKATNGKVIIAILNGEMLIRRFEKAGGNIKLYTDNGKESLISIDENCGEFAIWGVVTYVIHAP
jgi:DNA polymerase V